MTISTCEWVPEQHLPIVSELAYADERTEDLCNIVFEYITQEHGTIELTETTTGTERNVIVSALAPLPRKIPLLTAEIFGTLRNALEHTLFTEIEYLNATALTEPLARQIAMPISLTYINFQNWRKKRAREIPFIFESSSEIVRRIASLQPYQRISSPQEHPLALLASYTNSAKHRYPAIAAVSLPAKIPLIHPPLSIDQIKRREDHIPVNIGDTVETTALNNRVKFAWCGALTIWEPSTKKWKNLFNEIEAITEWVRDQTLPILIKGDTGTNYTMPYYFDIDSGHMEERAAIAQGSASSAIDKYKIRLRALANKENFFNTV